MKPLTVVIPVRAGGSPATTIHSLETQEQIFDTVIVSDSQGRGANWARNEGFRKVKTPYVLFSDDDIRWEPDALSCMLEDLKRFNVSYSYGAYEMEGRIYCAESFDPSKLRRVNYISTMSLIQSDHFPGFDEKIPRLQDWDLWLTMLEQGHNGHYCGKLIFRTSRRSGITYSGAVDWYVANRMVLMKHGLL